PGTAPSTITVAGVPITVVSVQDLGAVVQQVTPAPAPTPTPAPAPAPAPGGSTNQSKPTSPAQTTPKTPAREAAQPSKAPPKPPQPPTPAKPEKQSASQEPVGGKRTRQQTSGKKSKSRPS